MRRNPLFPMICAALLAGCEASTPPKTAADFDPNAPAPPPPATSATTGIAPLPSALASAPPPPPAPSIVPPSATAPIRWVFDGKSGLLGKDAPPSQIEHGRTMLLYPLGATPDCGNVNTNAVKNPNQSGQCQLIVSDVELKVAAGTSVTISVGITGGPGHSFAVNFTK